jgi:hypothetical protein
MDLAIMSGNPQYQILQLLAVGTYSVTITQNGCTSAAGTVDVIVNPGPATPTATATPNPLCEGQTLNLSTPNAGAGTAYSWTGPNGFSDNVRQPSIPNITTAGGGTYSVTITQNGCTSAAGTVDVTVNPGPATPTATATPNPLCEGQTLNLSTPNAGAGTAYSWTGPNGFSDNVRQPSIPNITTAGGGTYSVTITQNGCTSAAGTVDVTVNPSPATPTATATPNPLCVGQTLNLSTPNPGAGTVYSWTGPNGFSDNIRQPQYQISRPLERGLIQ